MASSPLATDIKEMLTPRLGEVTVKSMFGGFGLYMGGSIFGMVVDEVLYFKVGPSNQVEYEQAGSEPFSYQHKSGKQIAMSYWTVPPEVLEYPEALAEWAHKSVNAKRKKL